MISRLVAGQPCEGRGAVEGHAAQWYVGSAADAAQAVAIAKGYFGDSQTVENQISIAAPIQVTLRVRVAEISREVVRNLGVNWQNISSIGKDRFNAGATLNVNNNSLSCLGDGASSGGQAICPGANFNGVIDALAQDNLARILAEPNLTVMSGQQASFLVGGQFPIPIAQQNNAITIDYKNFGVSLSFRPDGLSAMAASTCMSHPRSASSAI